HEDEKHGTAGDTEPDPAPDVSEVGSERHAREHVPMLLPARAASETRLGHFQQLDLEDQRRLRRDDAAAAVLAVGEHGRDEEPALAADAHAGDAFVQAPDDVARAEREI